MKPVTDELLQEMTGTIVREVDPERVILFGSHATGRARPDSDVDFLVVEREPFGPQRSRWKEIGRIDRALARFLIPTDVLVYSADEINKWRNPINHVVGRCLREGRLLYARS